MRVIALKDRRVRDCESRHAIMNTSSGMPVRRAGRQSFIVGADFIAALARDERNQ